MWKGMAPAIVLPALPASAFSQKPAAVPVAPAQGPTERFTLEMIAPTHWLTDRRWPIRCLRSNRCARR